MPPRAPRRPTGTEVASREASGFFLIGPLLGRDPVSEFCDVNLVTRVLQRGLWSPGLPIQI